MIPSPANRVSVPKDPKQNLRFRRFLLDKAEADPHVQRAVIEQCKNDLFFYVNFAVWQYNPKRVGREVEPFILWDFQEGVLERTADRLFRLGRRAVWEKSREMGATWMGLILFDWACLFHGWKEFLWVSHTEDAVNSKSKNSLFWKLDFMHRHLPDWMSRGVKRGKFGFHYPATNSGTTGAATTQRAGVGGRASGVGLDEFALQRDAHEILAATRDTGPQLVISTHYGVGTAFAELCRRPDQHKEVIHWSQHPHKRAGLYRVEDGKVEVLDTSYRFPDDYRFVTDGTPSGGPYPGLRSVWYDLECVERHSSQEVAQHLDIDVEGSSGQYYHPLMIQRLKAKCWPELWRGDLHYERDSGRPTGLVPTEGGSLLLWLHPTPEGKAKADEYGIAADVSGGTGATPSCLTVVRLKTGEKVGEYLNAEVAPEVFGVLAVALCQTFADERGNPAILVWEHVGPGIKFAKTVLELGFRRVWYRVDEFDNKKSIATTPGWNPTTIGKRMAHDDYRAALDSGRFVNPSERALTQCLGYRYDATGNPEHPNEKNAHDPAAGRVNHGDLVVADMLAWMLASKTATVPGAQEASPVVPVGSLAWRRERHAKDDRHARLWT